MDKSILVKIFGFPATLIHGDTLVLDRWFWLKNRLPQTKNGELLLDVGCGTGAFSIGAALRGYNALGLSWDERNQHVAMERAKMCKTTNANFEIVDVRYLDTKTDFIEYFDIAICFENIEHIINDKKLITDIAVCLKPGGRLLLTTPNLLYRPISGEIGPFSIVEDGGHVRRGYTKAMLEELCQQANLKLEYTTYCSGFLSQKITFLYRLLTRLHPIVGWLSILPFRILPYMFDRIVSNIFNWPNYSICIEAYKPKYTSEIIEDN